MSMVSSSNLMSRFLPFSNHHQTQTREVRSLATTTNTIDSKAHLIDNGNEIAAIAVADHLADQLKNLAMAAAIAIAEEASTVPSSITPPCNTQSGLRRTVSSLHGRMPSTSTAQSLYCSGLELSSLTSRSSANGFCSHSNHRNTCIVEAKQVEMEFVTLTTTPFQLMIVAPNSECSEKLCFKNYGETKAFLPQQAGCGHGDWTFEMSTTTVANNKKVTKKWVETVYLDGVGSLFFSIDENLQIRLSSQEFLRLPSASQCCQKKLSA